MIQKVIERAYSKLLTKQFRPGGSHTFEVCDVGCTQRVHVQLNRFSQMKPGNMYVDRTSDF